MMWKLLMLLLIITLYMLYRQETEIVMMTLLSIFNQVKRWKVKVKECLTFYSRKNTADFTLLMYRAEQC